MNYERILEKVEKNELSPELAYKKLYDKRRPKPGKRATFIKLKIHAPEEGKGANTFLKILFALPIPMIFARMGVRVAARFAKFDSEDFDIKEITRLLKYAKNTRVSVESKDAVISIKII